MLREEEEEEEEEEKEKEEEEEEEEEIVAVWQLAATVTLPGREVRPLRTD